MVINRMSRESIEVGGGGRESWRGGDDARSLINMLNRSRQRQKQIKGKKRHASFPV